MSNETKACSVCSAVKPLTEFYIARGKHESFCKACRKAKVYAWREKTPGWLQREPARSQRLARAKEYSSTHPHLKKENNRRWAERYPERARLQHRLKMQLRRDGDLRDQIMARDQWRCLCCDATADLTIDHILPVLRGGTNHPDNLQTLCRACNSRKSDQTIDYRHPHRHEGR